MSQDNYYEFPPDLEAAAALGRASPWMTPRFYSFTEAREIIGCSRSTLNSYIAKWEEDFGPLPRTAEGRRLYSHSLTRLFEDRYDSLYFGRDREMQGAMSNFVRFRLTALLEIAREYHINPRIVDGVSEMVMTLLVFVHSYDLHWSDEVARYSRIAWEWDKKRNRELEQEYVTTIAELKERLLKAEAAIDTLTRLLIAAPPTANSKPETT